MPELPDLTVYREAMEKCTLGRLLKQVRLGSPFLLRTVAPAPPELEGRSVTQIRLIGKRLALGLDGEYWAVIHLMIAGRLHWKEKVPALSGKQNLAAFDFDSGSLLLTEAGSQRRAALHLAKGEHGLQALNPGGLDVMGASLADFTAAITTENHTLKRSLTDPRVLAGIGNSYSDEILHAAQLSPVALSQKLSPEDIQRLFDATKQVLGEWTERLRQGAAGRFPEKVTAFRKGMAVHGRYRELCPRCASRNVETRVERIRHATNETNYCPRCQTGGRVLADRSLSRLLHKDWPRTVEEWEALRSTPAANQGEPR